jgi:hypothetical protein
VVSAPLLWSARLMADHIVLCNGTFAVIQLAIAIGLFFRRTTKPALAASIAWSVSVWWFGEGLGGILTGSSPLTGAPGAVILYALIALLLWPADDAAPSAPVAPASAQVAPALRGPLGASIPKLAWLVLWAGFGWYLLLPANRAPQAVSQIFASMATGQAGWMNRIEDGLATVTANHGLAVSVLLALLCTLTGLAIFTGRLTRPAVVLACLLGLLFWVTEGFGGLTTGRATDPNSGPLLVLLAACFWPWADRQTRRIPRRCGLLVTWILHNTFGKRL